MAKPAETPGRDRSLASTLWFHFVLVFSAVILSVFYGVRATGRRNVPQRGSALLISNHLSYIDVFLLGALLPRPLNYVARSTLFVPVLGTLIRSLGGFPIQRGGAGDLGDEGDLPPAPQRRDRHALPRGHAQRRRGARRDQARHRGAGRAGEGPGPARGDRGHVRILVEAPRLPPAAPAPHSLRGADLRGGDRRPRRRRRRDAHPRPAPRMSTHRAVRSARDMALVS